MASDIQSDLTTRVAPARRGRQRGSSIPFWGLMFFTFILLIAPQAFIPILRPLRIAMLSAGLALVVYVIDRLSHHQPLTSTPPAVQFIFIFTLLAAISIPFAKWPGGAFEAFFNDLLKSVLIFVLVANVLNTVHRMKLMIWSMALWATIMSWVAVRDFATGNLALQGVRIAGWDSPLAANPNDLALIINLILALTIGLSAPRKPLVSACLLGFTALSIVGVISTFSRGGLVTLTTIAILWLIKRTRNRGPAILLLVLATVPLVLIALPAGYGNRVYSIFDMSADTSGSSAVRWESMVLAWNAILTNPVLGVGLKQHGLAFLEATGGWSSWNGVHNVYLEIAADLGIPALLLYLSANWYLLTSLRRSLRQITKFRGKRSREARELIALGSGIQIALVAFLVAAFFHPVAYHFYFFYIAGFAVAHQTITERTIRPRMSPP
jgi:putative inorganic carbon (HCO3(-)) transporter